MLCCNKQDAVYSAETASDLITIKKEYVNELDNVCRICLSTDCKMYVMTDYNLHQMYHQAVGVNVVQEDNLPQKFCWECAQRLINAYRFRSKALKTHMLLNEMLNDGKYVTKENIELLTLRESYLKPSLMKTCKVNGFDLDIIVCDVEFKWEKEDVSDKSDEELMSHSSDVPQSLNPQPVDIDIKEHFPLDNSGSDDDYTEFDEDKNTICKLPENIHIQESQISDAETVLSNQLPNKSREKYLKTYDNFIMWKNKKEADSFSENVLLAYFQHLTKTKLPSTLWSIYSMLKTTMNSKNNIQIETYSKLIAYLKTLSKGHKSKKSKVLTSDDVETFLNEAPDNDFLAIKVALIFGIHGACRGRELLNMTIENVEKHSDQLLLVNLSDNQTKIDRSFTIRGRYKSIVEKYQKLRPPDIETNRFFIRYQNGKCFKQNIGKNKISKMPEIIASYLKLPDPHLYTGHCFRRTSATLLADSGADLTNLHRHGGARSSVAKRNTEGSIENKTKI